jgi:hypothetical protein
VCGCGLVDQGPIPGYHIKFKELTFYIMFISDIVYNLAWKWDRFTGFILRKKGRTMQCIFSLLTVWTSVWMANLTHFILQRIVMKVGPCWTTNYSHSSSLLTQGLHYSAVHEIHTIFPHNKVCCEVANHCNLNAFILTGRDQNSHVCSWGE